MDFRATDRCTFSLLACSPSCFKQSHSIVEAASPVVEGYIEGIRALTVFNNNGLYPSFPTIADENRLFSAVLACSEYGKEDEERVTITLRDVSANGGRSAKYSNISVTRARDKDFAEYDASEWEDVSDDTDVSNGSTSDSDDTASFDWNGLREALIPIEELTPLPL
ncbi:hypothetical protein BU25DRAFT_454826 [Macroventuria anomochaeta]|uniref:Uncharacterized protein n=1 Tax=Macroventuria anomochaeta TaxID=301207 RepID=A0ACB6SAP6_9PLEO|nr:uncharacterized protein BU25DRAFT_454826 [Macroventuria anomochaeta]KAF2631371.1 hypothetical protein BU25DRAFT_454826 [Macroventuria anomochaeta]